MKTNFFSHVLLPLLKRRGSKKIVDAFPMTRHVFLAHGTTLLGALLFAFLPLFSQQVLTEEARARAMDAIEAKFDSLRGLPAPERNNQTAAFMKTQKEIAEAGVTDDGNVWALFKDGVPYEIFGNMKPLSTKPGSLAIPTEPTSARPWIAAPRLQGKDQPASSTAAVLLDNAFEDGGPALRGPFAASFYSPTAVLTRSSPQSNPSAQLQGNDLPESTQARVANALGNAFQDITGNIRSMLEANNGYKCAPGNDASVETLMNVKGVGVFFMEAHGGNGMIHDPVKGKNNTIYILTTSSLWTPQLTRKYIEQNLFLDGCLGLCFAGADRDPHSPSIVHNKRYYTITSLFIKKFWRFSENSFVFIHACTSNTLKETMRNTDVHASIFGGYSNLGDDNCLESALFLFDRMLGANEVEPREEIAPQRPFDFQEIAVDMARKGLNPIAKKPTCKILFGLGPGNFGLLNPSLKYARIIPYESRVELIGLFGQDPGEKNRKVEIENIAVPVESWEPEKIICHLPDSENGSCGEIKVTHRGRVSNSRWLTQWKGTADFREFEREDLRFNADFALRFVSDPWPYREHAGDKPISNRVWGVSSMSGSKCSWAASGQVLAYGGKVVAKWSGQGTPSVVTDVLLAPLSGTFEVGGPVTDLLGRDLWVSFAISDFFTELPFAKGDPRQGKRPTRLHAYNNGQSAVKIQVSEDFDFSKGRCPAADDRDDSGGEATWSEMKATHTMPKNARR
jgi:hypothetical protein